MLSGRIADYPRLSAYLKRLIALLAFRGAFSLNHIKRVLDSCAEPDPIVPLGPEPDWAPA